MVRMLLWEAQKQFISIYLMKHTHKGAPLLIGGPFLRILLWLQVSRASVTRGLFTIIYQTKFRSLLKGKDMKAQESLSNGDCLAGCFTQPRKILICQWLSALSLSHKFHCLFHLLMVHQIRLIYQVNESSWMSNWQSYTRTYWCATDGVFLIRIAYRTNRYFKYFWRSSWINTDTNMQSRSKCGFLYVIQTQVQEVHLSRTL